MSNRSLDPACLATSTSKMAVLRRLSSSSEQTAGRSQSYSEKLVWSSTVFSPQKTRLVSHINQYQVLKSVKIFQIVYNSSDSITYTWIVIMFSIFAFEIAVCATTEGGEDAILEQPTSLPKPASKTCDGTTKPTQRLTTKNIFSSF